MCAGFTPNAHDAPCGSRASEFETKPEGPRTVQYPKGENEYKSRSPRRVAYHTAPGDERGVEDTSHGSERVATAGPQQADELPARGQVGKL